MSMLNAVIFESKAVPGVWCAQILEYDIGSQAKSREEVEYELQRSLAGHIVICRENGVEPFAIPPAPRRFANLFHAAGEMTERTLEPTTWTAGADVQLPRLRLREVAVDDLELLADTSPEE